jgi:hypothetical protein
MTTQILTKNEIEKLRTIYEYRYDRFNQLIEFYMFDDLNCDQQTIEKFVRLNLLQIKKSNFDNKIYYRTRDGHKFLRIFFK